MFQLRSGRNNPNLHFIWSPSSPSQPVSESASIKATLQSNLLAFYISDPTVLIHYTYIHVFDDVALDYTVPPFFSVIICCRIIAIHWIYCIVFFYTHYANKQFDSEHIHMISELCNMHYWRRTLINLSNILNYGTGLILNCAFWQKYISVNILQFIVYNNSFIKWLSRWVCPIGVLSMETCGPAVWTGHTTSGRSRCQVRHTV